MAISSVQFSRSVVSGSLWPHGLQHARLPCQSPTPRVHLTPCPLSWCWHSTISSSVVPFSSIFNLSQHQGLLQWVGSLHQVTKVLEFHLQHQSFQWIFRADFLSDGLVEILWRFPQVGMINYWLFPVFFSSLEEECQVGNSKLLIIAWEQLLDHWKGKRVPEKHPFLFYWLCQNLWLCGPQYIYWKILKEMGIPDHLTCLLRNRYAGQEAGVRTGHGTDWFQIGKGVLQGCI